MVKRRFLTGFVVVLAFSLPAGRCAADERSLLEQADGHRSEKEYVQAEAIYRRVAADNVGSAEGLSAMEGLILLLIKGDKRGEAGSAYRQLMANYSDSPGLVEALSREAAGAFKDRKMFEIAAEIYEYILSHGPSANQVIQCRTGLFKSYLGLDEDVKAQAEFDALVTDFADYENLSDIILDLGGECRALRKWEACRSVCEYFVTRWGGDERAAYAQRLVAKACLKAGDEEGAAAATEKLLANYGDNPGIGYELAELADDYAGDKGYDKARSLYRYVVEHWPDSERGVQSQAGAVRCAILMGDDPNADAELAKLLEDYSASEGMAKTLDQVADEYCRARKYDKAKDLYAYVIATYPDSDRLMESIRGLAMAAVGAGDDANSVAQMERLTGEFSDDLAVAKAMYDVAAKYVESKRYEQAKSIYERIVEDYPQSEQANRAKLDVRKTTILALIVDGSDDSNLQEAVSALIGDFQSHAYLPRVLCDIARRYFYRLRYEPAIQLWELVLNDYPDSPVNGEAAYFLGTCHQRLNDWQRAVECYKLIVEKYPDSKYGHQVPYKIGVGYRFRGHPEEALYWLRKQREMYSDPLLAEWALFEQGAVYHFDVKDYGKAIEVFQEYLDEYPDDEHTWPAYWSMASCYEKSGNKVQAISVLEQALEQFAGRSEADQIAAQLAKLRKGAE